ncbi:MAG TPA: hypothetical protein VN493_29405 [Thermoanaerobaculia bacterium]|nr:hypothetical protein [Thermoanaerobaculia bacterium]
MSQATFPESKIQSPDLRRLAEDRSSGVASVIIELDLPARRVEVDQVRRRGLSTPCPRQVAPPTEKEGAEVEKRTAEARTFLQQVLGVSPRWLQTARSFVADVTGPQLRTIASSPLTKAIHPNRPLR